MTAKTCSSAKASGSVSHIIQYTHSAQFMIMHKLDAGDKNVLKVEMFVLTNSKIPSRGRFQDTADRRMMLGVN